MGRNSHRARPQTGHSTQAAAGPITHVITSSSIITVLLVLLIPTRIPTTTEEMQEQLAKSPGLLRGHTSTQPALVVGSVSRLGVGVSE